MNDQASALRKLVSHEKHEQTKMRVLAITSGKGGAGKTNFTVNVALALAGYGKRVIIFDGDLGLANVDISFGLTAKYTIEHLLAGEKSIEQILLPGPQGIMIIPGGAGVQDLANMERDKIANVITNLGRLEGLADVLLIDTGAGIGHTVTNFLRGAEEIILLTTPEPTALIDAYGVLKTLNKEAINVPTHVVANRVRTESEAQATFMRLETAASRFLQESIDSWGWVYDDPLMGRAVMQQVPLGIGYPESSAYRCIQWIAGTIIGASNHPPRQVEGIKGFLSKLLRSHS
ncbi:MinD/ParA family protein [Desulfosporosinus sp. SYSU MS00001]|uniref:MinD/ParA family protein n=1 Tax=Desulfosporosinus sp. SYSU MS00001 TaxID=3416284 RepID=UPI003CF0D6F5